MVGIWLHIHLLLSTRFESTSNCKTNLQSYIDNLRHKEFFSFIGLVETTPTVIGILQTSFTRFGKQTPLRLNWPISPVNNFVHLEQQAFRSSFSKWHTFSWKINAGKFGIRMHPVKANCAAAVKLENWKNGQSITAICPTLLIHDPVKKFFLMMV